MSQIDNYNYSFKAFNQHLVSFFPTASISEPFAFGGDFELRFELGGDLPNGSRERIEQATNRACTIFNEFFANKNAEIWILAYEDLNPYFDKTLNQYLSSLLKSSKL